MSCYEVPLSLQTMKILMIEVMKDYRGMKRAFQFDVSHMAMLFVACLVGVTGQYYADSPSSLMIGPPPMIMDDIDPTCWNFTYGNWRIQEFYTPNYPGEYLSSTDCVLYLEAPPGFKIQLDFRDKFILEKSEGCKYDYLEVRDGPFAYSPLISRYCNIGFPPIITSSGRFLWMRFKTDDVLQYGGFRAIYSYQKDHTQNDGAITGRGERMPTSLATSSTCRIPVKLSPDEADGILSSDDAPFFDDHDPGLSKGQSVDCTWEIHTVKGHAINLRSTEFNLNNRKRCDVNNVTIYEKTTLDSSIKEEYCRGNSERVDITSDSNRVFVRMYVSSDSSKPEIKMVYTLIRKGDCNDLEFRCGDVCLPASLYCNGVDNCKDRSDEKGCSRPRSTKGRTSTGGSGGGSDVDEAAKKSTNEDVSSDDSAEETTGEAASFPIHIIILGVVGGFIITCVTISLCIMCRIRKRDKEKRQEAARQKSSQRNALEMAVCNSSSTTISLSRQKSEGQTPRTGGGPDRQHYVMFPKMMPSSPGGGIDDNNRYSVSERGMAPMDSDSIQDQMTESGNYKRFLSMDITPDDIIVESKQLGQQGKYPPSPGGVIGMTNVDHRKPDVYQHYHGNQWHSNVNADGMIYPYGSSSLTRPTPYLGLSKQFTYSQPDNKYESKYLKSLKAMENDTIREHQSS